MAFTDPEYAQFLPGMGTFTKPVKATTKNAVVASSNAAAKQPEASPTITNAGLVAQIPTGSFSSGGATYDEAGRRTSAPPTSVSLPTMPARPAYDPNRKMLDPWSPPGADASGVTAKGTPFKASTTSAPDITRVDAPGQSPLFTNMAPAVALDDINNKRSSPLPSVAGFMGGVKDGSFGLLAPTAQPQPYVSALRSRSDSLYQQADATAASGGIVDLWKARGMRRSAKILGEQATADEANAINAQANAIRSQGQAQQLQLGMGDLFTRQRGQDMAFLPQLGDVAIGAGIAKAVKEGKMDDAAAYARVKMPGAPQNPKFQAVTDPISGTTSILNVNTGEISRVPTPEERKKAELQQAKAKAETK